MILERIKVNDNMEDNARENLKKEICKKYNLHKIVVDLLFARNIDSEEKIENFLHPSDKQFYDPFLLSGMDKLVERVKRAIENNEKVLIFGDYDVDGVSASAILIKYFASIHFYVDYFLPNRYVDGYGLTNDAIDFVKNKFNPTLIITVDCGISCHNEVEYAKTLGIDIVITDHHDIPEVIPNTIVVNAKLPNQQYPFKYLCGTGVAFKVVQALSGLQNAKKYLGIASIATIADIVPLLDENRLIVKEGMKSFNSHLPQGIKMLMADNKLDMNATSTDIAFKLAPKINAAGRMGDASVALKLYIKDDKIQLENTIQKLNELNLERQALCNKVYEDVVERLSKINIANYKSIVLFSKKWDSGILGIVSAKVANEFNRPTILLSEVGDELKGSARSVNDIDIFSAISSMKEVLEAFGGHKMAAGLTLKTQNFKSFLSSLNDYLDNHYSEKDFLPAHNFDLNLSICDINEKLARDLEVFEPCGCDNPKPVFNVTLTDDATFSTMAKHPNHLNISDRHLSIVAFNSSKYLPLLRGSSLKQIQLELQLNIFKNKAYLKGVAKNITTGFLGKPKNDDVIFGEYLKQLSYDTKLQKRFVTFSKVQLENFVKKTQDEFFGTLFVCSTFESYEELLPLIKQYKSMPHYLYRVIANSGINSVVLAPTNFENWGAYKNIVFLDAVLSKGFLGKISQVTNAQIFVPNYKKVDRNIFVGLSVDRKIFGEYFKLLSNFASLQTSFLDEIDLYKQLTTMQNHPKINFKQFIFCLYVFIELGIFSLISDMDYLTLVENKKVFSSLNNSKFFSEITEILETI